MVVKSEAAKVNTLVLMDKDKIKDNQDAIKTSLTGLDVAIHSNAIQCMLHAEKHGDTSLMRRLLVDIVGKDSGYRRQGLIAWMRTYSPMELRGDNINLSGKDKEGNPRPFKVEDANDHPFKSDTRFKEQVKPVFQATLMSPIQRAMKDFRASVDNTDKDGKAIDATKPIYDGKNTAELIDFFAEVEKRLNALPVDNTNEVRKAEQQLAEAKAANG